MTNYNTTPPIDLVLPRLEGVKTRGRHQWSARCPAHDDKSPSLSIREADDGRLLLHCFGGCSPHDVVGALGIELGDLFPREATDHRVRRGAKRPLFNPWHAFDLLEHDLWLILFATEKALQGEPMTRDDIAALDDASADIRRIIEEARACR